MIIFAVLLAALAVAVASTTSLNCNFTTPCCWRAAEGEGSWERRDFVNINEFRRTFLVSKGKPPPQGAYLMRVESVQQEGGSSYMSCPFCTSSDVIIRYRHWQSPTAQVDLCWQAVEDGENADDQEECIRISAKEQSRLAERRLKLPKGKQMQIYFVVENLASSTHAVLILDKIELEYKSCAERKPKKVSPFKLPHIASAPLEHSATHFAHENAKEALNVGRKRMKNVEGTVKRKLHNLETEQGIRRLRIKKLSVKDQQLNAEIARQIRHLETSDTETIHSRVKNGRALPKIYPVQALKQQQQKQETAVQQPKKKPVPVVPVRSHKPIPSEVSGPSSGSRTVVPLPKAAGAERVSPSLASTPHQAVSLIKEVAKERPAASSPNKTKSPVLPKHLPTVPEPVPAPPASPKALGKDFNPLEDLVGSEFTKFLDPNFVTNDANEADDPEADEYFRQQNLNSIDSRVVSNVPTMVPDADLAAPVVPQPVATAPPLPPTTVTPPPTLIPTTPAPTYTHEGFVHHLFRHPHECSAPGGCMFERGLCSYTHPDNDPNRMFKIVKIGHTSFAQATAPPNSNVVMEAPTKFDREYLVVLDVLETSAQTRFIGCCKIEGVEQLHCPLSTPEESSFMVWQSARFSCPANTSKLIFMCENRGATPTTCSVDNLRLHLPGDILFLEPCQKGILQQL